MTVRPAEARRPESPESRIAYAAPSVEPMAGVSSLVIAAAARRVAQRVRDDGVEPADLDVASTFLAAIALAVDRDHPRYATDLVQRLSPRVGARLVEMLRTEVINRWATSGDSLTPAGMLQTLGAIERVREAIEPEPTRLLAERPVPLRDAANRAER